MKRFTVPQQLFVASRLAQARVLKRATPVQVGIEVTHRCNLRCKYCDRNKPKEHELETAEILTILDGFHRLGTRMISLDGGEPLLRADLPAILERAQALGLIIRMNTNGILIPQRLDLLRPLHKLKISLDGAEADHDQMRGAGSFQKVLKGIEAAKGIGIPVELTCVLHRQNLKGVEPLLKVCEKLDCRIIFQPVRDSLVTSAAGGKSAWNPEFDELRAVFRTLLAEKARNPFIANQKSSLRHFTRFPDDVKLPCAAGWINCTVDPEGYLYHCGQISRDSYKVSIRALGVERAFREMRRFGCPQCWCARTVEENYAWGLKLGMML